MELLLKLVRFQIYSTTSDLQMLVEPIANALDQRKDASYQQHDRTRTSTPRSTSQSTSKAARKSRPSRDSPKPNQIASDDADLLEVSQDDSLPEKTWPKRAYVYDVLDGLYMMGVVLTLVFVGLALTLTLMTMSNEEEDGGPECGGWGYKSGSTLFPPVNLFCSFVLFNHMVTVFFMIELPTRWHCYTCKFPDKSTMSFTNDNFNKLDVLIVAIDVVLYTLDVLMGGGAGPIGAFAKSLRGLRIFRLLRVLRAAKAISKLRDAVKKTDVTDDWELPRRYSHTPEAKLETMLQMVGVLSEITRFSRDYHLSQLLALFKERYEERRKEVGSSAGGGLSLVDSSGITPFTADEAAKYPHCGNGNPELLTQLWAIFKQIDADDSDDLDAMELRECMKLMGVKMSLADSRRVLTEVDEDGNGTIDFDEFTHAWSKQSPHSGTFIELKKRELRKEELSIDEPVQVFQDTMDKSKALRLDAHAPDFDTIFLDLCLYTHEELVQSALDVLMVHHSARHSLLEDLSGAQILNDPEDEKLFRSLEADLAELQSHAEKQELWGELETDDDLRCYERVKVILQDLTEACREVSPAFQAYSCYSPRESVQNMLRNLGAFEVALSVLGLEAAIEGASEQSQQATEKMLQLTFLFLAWLIRENVENQEVGYDMLLDTICDSLGEGYFATLTLAEIFRGNAKLVKLFPESLVGRLVECSVANDEHDPNHLEVLSALTDIDKNTGENNVPMQFALLRELTLSTRINDVMFLCADARGDQAQVREAMMVDAAANDAAEQPSEKCAIEPELGVFTARGDLAHMPRLLAYHCRLLDALAGTALGRQAITTVEAKLQNMFSPDSLLRQLADPHISLEVKDSMANFLYHVVIDVEIVVPGLASMPSMWEYLALCPQSIDDAQRALGEGMVCNGGATGSREERQARLKVAYAMKHCEIVRGFFEFYWVKAGSERPEHDPIIVGLGDGVPTTPGTPGTPDRDSGDVNKTGQADSSDVLVIGDEGGSSRDEPPGNMTVTDMPDSSMDDPPGDPSGPKVAHFAGMFATARPGSPGAQSEGGEEGPQVYWADDRIREIYLSIREFYVAPKCNIFTMEHQTDLLETLERLMDSVTSETRYSLERPTTAPDLRKEERSKFDEEEKQSEEDVVMALETFIEQLQQDEDLATEIRNDRVDIVAVMEALPYKKDTDAEGDLRFEPLVAKLVEHTRSRIVVKDGAKSLDARCTRSTIWTIQIFRAMIENAWARSYGSPMSIDERDNDGGGDEDEAAAPVQDVLNSNGVTGLCLDLIAVGIEPELIVECVKLCVAMLFKEGGHKDVQNTMFAHLNNFGSFFFFSQMREIIQTMIKWYRYGNVPVCEEGEDPEVPDMLICLRFLQLMCEGHHADNQNIMREQPNNRSNINLLDDFVELLNTCSKKPSRSATKMSDQTANTILEVIQGPCLKTQEHLAMYTDLCEIINRILRAKPVGDCDEDEDEDVKKCTLEIFEALVEGQCLPSAIINRILSVIDMEVLIQIVTDDDGDEEEEEEEGGEEGEGAAGEEDEDTAGGEGEDGDGDGDGGEEEDEDEFSEIQIEGLVLLQIFFDFHPALKEEYKLPKKIQNLVGNRVRSVEVVWLQQLQRRFFPIPDLLVHLSEGTKGNFSEAVERSSPEAKLEDFYVRTRDIYRELKHQEWLTDYEYHLSFKERTFLGFTIVPEVDETYKINLAKIFSVRNQESVTTIAFVIVCVIQTILALTLAHPTPCVYSFGNATVNNMEALGLEFGQLGNGIVEGVLNDQGIATSEGAIALGATPGIAAHICEYDTNNFISRDLPAAQSAFSWDTAPNGAGSAYGNNPDVGGSRSDDVTAILNRPHGPWTPGLYYKSLAWWLSEQELDAKAALDPVTDEIEDDKVTGWILTFLNIANVVCSMFTFVLFCFVRAPVRYMKLSDPEDGAMTKGTALLYTATDGMTVYYFVYTIIAVIAFVVDPQGRALGTLLLLDIVIKVPTAKLVLYAVYKPALPLAMTLLLGIFALYIFAFSYFQLWGDEFAYDDIDLGFDDENNPDFFRRDCMTLWGCYKVTVDYGLRLSGGVGDIMTHTLDARMTNDFLYFLVILVILLNIIFGIIIDTFSSLRTEKVEKEKDKNNVCFICGIRKIQFDRAADEPGGFTRHYRNDHNVWDYLSFVVFIYEQDKDDDDGLELYVRKLIEQRDISWFPINKAICLTQKDSEDDDQTMEERLGALEQSSNDSVRDKFEDLVRSFDKATENLCKVIDGVKVKQELTHHRAMDKIAQAIATVQAGPDPMATGMLAGGVPRHPGDQQTIAKLTAAHASLGGETATTTGGFGASRRQVPEADGEKKVPSIKVIISDAQGLAATHLFGTGDHFVFARVVWMGTEIGQTDTIWLSEKPEWRVKANTFTIKLPHMNGMDDVLYEDAFLRIELQHMPNKYRVGAFLGAVEFPWESLRERKSRDKAYHKLVRRDKLTDASLLESPTKVSQSMVQGKLGMKVYIDEGR